MQDSNMIKVLYRITRGTDINFLFFDFYRKRDFFIRYEENGILEIEGINSDFVRDYASGIWVLCDTYYEPNESKVKTEYNIPFRSY